MIKGVIFDVDGTLIDSMPVWTNAGERYLATLGIQAEPHLGDKLFVMTVTMGAEYLKKTYKLSQNIDEIKNGINHVMEDFYRMEAPLKPGALDLLEQFYEKKIPMTVATSTDRYCIDMAFERLNLHRFFEEIYTCTEVGASKSEPKIFFEATEKMGTPIEETWVFEDGLYAMKTAKAEGFKIVGVYDRISEKDQEEIKAISDIYVTDVRDLKF